MPVYVFQGDVFCDSCGSRMLDEIEENEADMDFPVPFHGEESHDSPIHCGSGEGCEEYIQMEDGSRIGELLTDSLTDDGIAYVRDTHRVRPTLVSGLWMQQFDIPYTLTDDDAEQIREHIEAMMPEAVNPEGTIVITIGDERVTLNLRQAADPANRGRDGKAVPVDMILGCSRETNHGGRGWEVSGD